jgi:hypothetical protein
VLLESLELLDGAKEFHKFANTATEQVELAKDLSWVEVKLLGLGELFKARLCELVLLDVGIMQVNAGLQDNDEFIWRVVVMVPQARVVNGSRLLASGNCLGKRADGRHAEADATEVNNVILAVVDHLVGDLHEEASHALVGVVVTRNGVDHLDGVHESGKGFLDRLRVAFVEGLNELFESLQILNVVLSFIEGLSHAKLNSAPLRGSKEDLVAGLANISIGLRVGSCKKDVEHGGAVLGAKLFRDAS